MMLDTVLLERCTFTEVVIAENSFHRDAVKCDTLKLRFSASAFYGYSDDNVRRYRRTDRYGCCEETLDRSVWWRGDCVGEWSNRRKSKRCEKNLAVVCGVKVTLWKILHEGELEGKSWQTEVRRIKRCEKGTTNRNKAKGGEKWEEAWTKRDRAKDEASSESARENKGRREEGGRVKRERGGRERERYVKSSCCWLWLPDIDFR